MLSTDNCDCTMPTWSHTGPRYPMPHANANWDYEKVVLLASIVVLFY